MSSKDPGDLEFEAEGIDFLVPYDLDVLVPKISIDYEEDGLKMGFNISSWLG